MKWEELLNEDVDYVMTGQRLTNIDCPDCGRKIYLDTSIILTSYPAKYKYWCACGWKGYAPTRWDEEWDGEEG